MAHRYESAQIHQLTLRLNSFDIRSGTGSTWVLRPAELAGRFPRSGNPLAVQYRLRQVDLPPRRTDPFQQQSFGRLAERLSSRLITTLLLWGCRTAQGDRGTLPLECYSPRGQRISTRRLPLSGGQRTTRPDRAILCQMGRLR